MSSFSGNLITEALDIRNEMGRGSPVREECRKLRRSIKSCAKNGTNPSTCTFVFFKITDRCNSNCAYCLQSQRYGGNNRAPDAPLSLIKRVVKEAAELGAKTFVISGGEPLVRKDVAEIVRYTVSLGVVPVLLTNGLLLPQKWRELGDAGLRYVIISCDSIQAEVYERQRGVSFQSAMAGIDAAEQMLHEYAGMRVNVSAVLTRNSLGGFVDLVKEMTPRGIAVEVSPYHHFVPEENRFTIHDREGVETLSNTLLRMKNEGYLISSSRGFIEHLDEFFRGHRVPKGYSCPTGYTNLFIDPRMDAHLCWDSGFPPLGNVATKSIHDIWFSEAAQQYRKRMLCCDCGGCWFMCSGEVTMMLKGRL